MSDDDKIFKVGIKTSFDAAGAKQAEQSIDLLKSKTEDFKKVEAKWDNRNQRDAAISVMRARISAQKEVNEELRREQVIAQQRELFNKLKQEAAAAEKASFSLKGLTNSLSQFGSKLLGISGLGRCVGSVFTVAILLIVTAVTKAVHAFKDFNDELDRQAEILGRPDFIAAFKARREVLEQSAVSSAQFANRLIHLQNPEEVFQKKLQDEIELLRTRNQAVAEAAEATEALAQSQLRHAQGLDETGLLTQLAQGSIKYKEYLGKKIEMDVKYMQALTNLEVQHEQEKLDRDIALRAAELEIETKGLEHSKKRQPQLEKDAASAARRSVDAATIVADHEEDVKILENAQKENEENIKKAEQNMVNRAGGVEETRFSASKGNVLDRAAIEHYDDLLNNRSHYTDEISKKNRQIAGEKITASTSLEDLNRSRAYVEANQSRIADKEEQVDLMRDKNAQLNLSESVATGARNKNLRVNESEELEKVQVGPFSGGQIANAVSIESLKAQHKPITDTQRKTAEQFEQFTASLGIGFEKFNNLIAIANGKLTSQQQKTEALAAIVLVLAKATEGKLGEAFNEITVLTKRIRDINNK